MQLDYDITVIRENKITLLDCQVDLILRSLEFYSYAYRYIFPRKKLTDEEDLRISLVTDTYQQILSEFSNSKKENQILDFDENLQNKKIA